MKKIAALRTFSLVSLTLICATVNGEPRIPTLVIFGDSLSDPGNVWHATGEVASKPYGLIPARPYPMGGHTFSNGKTWAERLAAAMQANQDGRSALAQPAVATNYAFGGARARLIAGANSPSAREQVALFLGNHGAADPSTLFVLQFGGNDLRDALVAALPGTPEASAQVELILKTAIADTAGALQALHANGARRFLVINAPNLEHAPAIRIAGAGAVSGFLVSVYNGLLEGAIQQLELMYTDASILRFDLAGFLDDVVERRIAENIDVVDTPCLAFFSTTGAICSNPNRYLFWDGIHPTAAAHAVLADNVLELLTVQ